MAHVASCAPCQRVIVSSIRGTHQECAGCCFIVKLNGVIKQRNKLLFHERQGCSAAMMIRRNHQVPEVRLGLGIHHGVPAKIAQLVETFKVAEIQQAASQLRGDVRVEESREVKGQLERIGALAHSAERLRVLCRR